MAVVDCITLIAIILLVTGIIDLWLLILYILLHILLFNLVHCSLLSVMLVVSVVSCVVLENCAKDK